MVAGSDDAPLRLIVFDYDGTLVDSQGAIVQAMTEAFQAAGSPGPDAAGVRRVVGLSLDDAVARLMHRPSDDPLVTRVAHFYREAFLALRAAPDYQEPLFAGVRETLAELDGRDLLLGIATGKARRGLLASLDRHGLTHHFATLQTADLGPGKPHPAMLQRAMAETGTTAEHSLLIGDTVFDMEMARNAGVRGLGVAWGYHRPGELLDAGALAILDALCDIRLHLRPCDETAE